MRQKYYATKIICDKNIMRYILTKKITEAYINQKYFFNWFKIVMCDQ